MSALTYLPSAAALIGGVQGRLPVLAHGFDSGGLVICQPGSPASVGGMALNARYLQKSGSIRPQALRRSASMPSLGRRSTGAYW